MPTCEALSPYTAQMTKLRMCRLAARMAEKDGTLQTRASRPSFLLT
jgi:hypothetical protein